MKRFYSIKNYLTLLFLKRKIQNNLICPIINQIIKNNSSNNKLGTNHKTSITICMEIQSKNVFIYYIKNIVYYFLLIIFILNFFVFLFILYIFIIIKHISFIIEDINPQIMNKKIISDTGSL